MEYETGNLKFVDTGSHVVVYRNGEKWGVPQGDKFLRALILDIQKLNGEIGSCESQLEYIKELVSDIKDTKDLPKLRNEYMKKLIDFLDIE